MLLITHNLCYIYMGCLNIIENITVSKPMENCTRLFLFPQSINTHISGRFIHPQTNFPGLLTCIQVTRGAGHR